LRRVVKKRVGRRSVMTDIYSAWVMGYLSRAAAERPGDILVVVDADAVEGWLDNYCSKNPLDPIVEAAEKLESELVTRTRPRPSKRN
jgi:hypothetical protein